ncbi:hypothetical protein [Streptomyces acidiscabies]|uniref:Uncharacterized protein n=1 Tax=Streptomyces acidiscabies TaxID=42234 RepID=A0ABU4LX91_9ACTN|nr:hypothetical protein [Streptomyces acidiscabies]MDX3019884.1 hypothetical protein [Streptomyces acidiscabies]
MCITIRFVGGPADGQTLAIADVEPPPLFLVPEPPSVADLISPFEAAPIRRVEYEPVLRDGWPSRADDGVYLYAYCGVPVTPEERRVVEAARQESAAAEAAKEALLDEGWREIRKERPHYPERWRDLF